MSRDVIVLGAGMVGVGVAYHLVRRGHDVTLVDRHDPGQETSFGNAGIIQREAVEPYAFPHDPKTLLRIVPNRRIDIRYRPGAVMASAGPLLQYWLHSLPARYAQIVPEYASLIMRSTETHAPMIEAAGAQALVARQGWLELYRDAQALEKRATRARALRTHYGVEFGVLDRRELQRLEPHLCEAVRGAIHWQNAWTVASPGDLVKAYADLFVASGGRLVNAEVKAFERVDATWRVVTDADALEGSDLVLALGPWASDWVERLGYRMPLFVKRGYHMHYAHDETRPLNHWLMDAELGYLIEPMARGVRLTTGAELNRRESRPHRSQLEAAERKARELYPALGSRIDADAWQGARPCTPDMKPIIGPAPRHEGLWFAFGHGHQGFTLGPVTGLLLGQMMDGETPATDPSPFSPARFA